VLVSLNEAVFVADASDAELKMTRHIAS